MKLAEALAERAALNKALAALKEQAIATACHWDGDEQTGDNRETLGDYRRTVGRFAELVTAINLTNAQSMVRDAMTVTAAIALRDAYSGEIALLEATVRASRGEQLYGRMERARVLDADLPAIRARIDELSGLRRTLDNDIQRRGWEIDLIGL